MRHYILKYKRERERRMYTCVMLIWDIFTAFISLEKYLRDARGKIICVHRFLNLMLQRLKYSPVKSRKRDIPQQEKFEIISAWNFTHGDANNKENVRYIYINVHERENPGRPLQHSWIFQRLAWLRTREYLLAFNSVAFIKFEGWEPGWIQTYFVN